MLFLGDNSYLEFYNVMIILFLLYIDI